MCWRGVCIGSTGGQLLIHNIWVGSTPQPLGDQDVISHFPGEAAALRDNALVAAAGIGGALHVLNGGGELRHTIRLNATTWQSTFGLVIPAVNATPPSPPPPGVSPFTRSFSYSACANDGGNLHVCAISDGSIFHTIRISDPAAWRNPEEGTFGFFGNVLNAVPAGSTGSPPRRFTDIACSGS
jgi:hypothetical protein